MPSTPGAPRLARTSPQPSRARRCGRLCRRGRGSGDPCPAWHSGRARVGEHEPGPHPGAADGPSRYGTRQSFCSFPCIDEVRALPHVAGFPDPRVLRPAPTAARPPMPLPGFAGYRPGIASHPPTASGARRLSQFQDDHSHVQHPYTPEGSSAPTPGTRALSVAFALRGRARLPLPRPRLASLTTLHQGFTRVADRTIHPAPLRTRPLDHARGHHFREPRRLPGPD